MSNIGYRTDPYSEINDKSAAEIMSIETFELGNIYILSNLIDSQNGLLRNCEPIRSECEEYLKELTEGYLDNLTFVDGVDFFNRVIEQIKDVTGFNIKYALWLYDCTNPDNICFEDRNYLFYEKGPIILSPMGHAATLYGYEEAPILVKSDLDSLVKKAQKSKYYTFKKNNEFIIER